LEWAVAGGVSPSGPDGDGLYTWDYVIDNDADTLVSKSIEVGDNLTVYQVPGALCTRLRLSYSALKPGNASPWSIEATVVGYDKASIGAFTADPTVQDAPETAMGHLTRLYYGPVSTAFDDLPQLVHSLVSLDITIETGVLLRKQGGTDDRPDGHGRGKVSITYTALVESIEATKEQVWDVFEQDAVNPVVPDRRMRWMVSGSPVGGTNEVQHITITGSPSGGSFTATFGADTTGPIVPGASAGAVQAALQSLLSIGYGNVVVTGPNGGPWIVTFVNSLGYQDVAEMTTTDSFTGGTAPASAVTTATPGTTAAEKSITMDGTVEVTSVPVQESDGATRYAMTGQYVKDDDLSSIAEIVVVNKISDLPDAA
jgi:hypothetical protein